MNYSDPKYSNKDLLQICKDLGIKCNPKTNKQDIIDLLQNHVSSIPASLVSISTPEPITNSERTLEDSKVTALTLCEMPKFSLTKYLESLEERIKIILLRPQKNVLTYDILDTEKSKTNKLLVLKEKQIQMKVGEIWQEVLGNYDGCINLKTGHETGLDILSHTNKFIIELKNRTNTDNASSKKSNLDKLVKFKQSNPEYRCIYAYINADTEEKTLDGSVNKLLHDGVEIEHKIGYEFLKFILGDNTELIIDFVKNTIDKYRY